MRATLHKSERLSGVKAISALMSKGRWGAVEGLRYCFLSPNGTTDGKSRIAVAVPKRLFKRAVKRNLLKRRLREAYRTQKWMLLGEGEVLEVEAREAGGCPEGVGGCEAGRLPKGVNGCEAGGCVEGAGGQEAVGMPKVVVRGEFGDRLEGEAVRSDVGENFGTAVGSPLAARSEFDERLGGDVSEGIGGRLGAGDARGAEAFDGAGELPKVNARGGVDILFVYNSKEVLDYQSIRSAVEAVLRRIRNARK